jgi:hypothetical protein
MRNGLLPVLWIARMNVFASSVKAGAILLRRRYPPAGASPGEVWRALRIRDAPSRRGPARIFLRPGVEVNAGVPNLAKRIDGRGDHARKQRNALKLTHVDCGKRLLHRCAQRLCIYWL